MSNLQTPCILLWIRIPLVWKLGLDNSFGFIQLDLDNNMFETRKFADFSHGIWTFILKRII